MVTNEKPDLFTRLEKFLDVWEKEQEDKARRAEAEAVIAQMRWFGVSEAFRLHVGDEKE